MVTIVGSLIHGTNHETHDMAQGSYHGSPWSVAPERIVRWGSSCNIALEHAAYPIQYVIVYTQRCLVHPKGVPLSAL